MEIKKLNIEKYVILDEKDNYYQPNHCCNEPDFRITVKEMIKRYPESVFKELYMRPTNKRLNKKLTSDLFKLICQTNRKLMSEFDNYKKKSENPNFFS